MINIEKIIMRHMEKWIAKVNRKLKKYLKLLENVNN